jgi:hypothetical protein
LIAGPEKSVQRFERLPDVTVDDNCAQVLGPDQDRHSRPEFVHVRSNFPVVVWLQNCESPGGIVDNTVAEQLMKGIPGRPAFLQ